MPGDVLLCEVHEAGQGEDRHKDEEEEEAELFVGLLQGVKEGLKTSEVTDQLEDPHDSHHTDKSHDLPGFACQKCSFTKLPNNVLHYYEC